MAKFDITGKVLGPDGNPIRPSINIDLIDPVTRKRSLRTKTTSNGDFSLTYDATGVVVVRYETPSGLFLPGGSDIQCQAITQTLPVVQYQFGRPTVQGKVERKTGSTTQPAAGVQVELLD